MYDIIIIGSGIAGLTSAIYALNNKRKVLILESKTYGGQIINSNIINNYPGFLEISGFDLMTNIYNQVKNLGGVIKYEEVLEITKNKKVITKNETYEAKSIIVSTGLAPRKLNLENEDKFIGKGISYCATCDGSFYKDKDVMVVGGGNTAIEDVIYLSNICKKVYLVYRRKELRKDVNLTEKVKELSNVEIIYNSNIEKLNGDESLKSVDIINKDTEKITNIIIDGLFVAIGKIPSGNIFKDLLNVTENGYIITDEDCHTNIDGIYAAGDIRKKRLRQLVTAASDGAIAAIEAIKYINKK